ncbi:hypothetical protein KAFR_0A04600 [Kazachstania africana CBS 2517]|uniref:C3H1-type domain-containing protein n=1 Tax=Kazachstania africana (strain ATCC 22294 / BCRC 22015 / CBS 2517 / CECT 1963 / NBRC 1671 / NRRL Y-8276) TaxID=1071382 RepID=H2ANE5_KAZAF|nr:hypothetical protein KAFR_0A04600 [Kazachstania africana CBS 2517]CCF55895.1 hypothetical protein KAFR_0A04600 [Kazachstania africana CBS 2517]
MSEQQYTESLKVIVAEKLKGVENFTEDVNYVAEYIVLLIVNGGTLESIVQELSTLFDAISTDALTNVVQTAFFALEALQQGETTESIVSKIQAMNVQQTQQETPPQTLPPVPAPAPAPVQEPVQPQPQLPSQPVSAFSGIVSAEPIPQSTDISMDMEEKIVPVADFKPRFSNRGGINKRGRGGRGASSRGGSRFANNGNRYNPLARALGMADSNNVNFTRQKKEGRCKLFPHCPLGRSCPHAHPTKPCSEYPNCPKPPGTCEYLHPNEDEELMKEIERTREEFQKRKEALLASRQKPVQTGIVLCKFGVLCSNPMCPFGHPTPANEDAKVIDLMWCKNNLKCEDPNCTKAHSSLSKIRQVEPMGRPQVTPTPVPPQRAPVEKSLEQCKFGAKCTNKRCKYRHARSHIMCREGAACTRIDCFFGHPINEDCRFGVDCKNATCLFKHPEGRVVQPPSAKAGEPQLVSNWNTAQNVATNERMFALPDASNIEPAPRQETFAFAPQSHAENDTEMN